MALQILSVCVGYDDFLEITLPTWRAWSDYITIVTTRADKATQFTSMEPGVSSFISDAFHRGGATFDKGGALGEAIQVVTADLTPDDWLLILDADIVLPQYSLDLSKLDKTMIYGAPRRYCETLADWRRVCRTGRSDFLHLEFGGRINRQISGFFQLGNWGHWQKVCPEFYCSNRTAALSDVWTSQKWGFGNQRFLPGLQVIHLGKNKVNWSGRRTQRFGATCDPRSTSSPSA